MLPISKSYLNNSRNVRFLAGISSREFATNEIIRKKQKMSQLHLMQKLLPPQPAVPRTMNNSPLSDKLSRTFSKRSISNEREKSQLKIELKLPVLNTNESIEEMTEFSHIFRSVKSTKRKKKVKFAPFD